MPAAAPDAIDRFAPGAPVDRGGYRDRSDGPGRRNDDHPHVPPAVVHVLGSDPASRQALVAAIAAIATAGDPIRVDTDGHASDRDPDRDIGLIVIDAGEADGSAPTAGLPPILDESIPHLATLRADARYRHTPILVVVPPPPQAGARIRQALADGATDVLVRPLDPAELTLRLRNALSTRHDRDQLLRHDALTGLPNRAEFLRRVAQLFANPPAQPQSAAPRRTLLLLNLDRFKPVNASLGHAAGDALLVAVAARLADIISRHVNAGRRDGDTDDATMPWLARTESDGFVAMLPGGRGDPGLEACLAEIVAGFEQAHAIAGHDLVMHASVGLASYPADGVDVTPLMQRATLAMEYAKRRGGRRLAWFDGIVERRAADRLLTEQQLRHAIGAGELRLWYQPKADCATLAMVGAEALVRWQHPERGLIGPQWFVPVAEASGLIVELGDWVIDEACRQGRAWLAAGLPPIDIAVNVSAGQTRRGDLVATVRDALARNGYPPGRLTLELTESLLIADDEATNRMIGDLRAQGVALSLDDFGTGFASMTMLRRFAFDEIKIDRSFIRGLPARRDGVAITRAIATLAGDLGLDVVAEGVESAAELTFLRSFPGCRFQGELFSRPVDALAFGAMLATTAHRPPTQSGPRDTP